ncbi:MAG: adenylate/guanylate cyclase domain-containing protein [Actinomycetota bacterium]
MPRLRASDRAKLPDSAFAYVDSSGRRRLPIHDESHVRNALARFDQVAFEDEGTQERARKRLLKAAKRYGIVPVGFIDGQLRRYRARSGDVSTLPSGPVTFLMTDIEGSTELLRKLSDRYAGLLKDVRGIVRREVNAAGGREVDARADEFFAVFEGVVSAVEAAVAIQRAMSDRVWPDDLQCRVRVGIHSGEVTLTDTGYIGLSVHTTARVASAAHGGQIVVSGDAKRAAAGSLPAGVRLRGIGRHRLPGLTRAESLFQVEADGLASEFPPPRTTG